MGRNVIDADLEAELAGIAASAGCELLHVAFQNGTLRVFLDREDGGVTLDHCQTVSRQISALLDVHDFGQRKYLLEVSSPGLDRELYGPRDYERFQGHLIRITYFTADSGQKRTLVGSLESFDPSGHSITVLERSTQERHEIPLERVKLARLEIEL